MVIFTIFLTLFVFFVNNILLWWSVFLLITVLFLFINKSVNNIVVIFNYFVLQEVIGLFFLMFFFGFFQFIIIIFKLGVSPFHFWIFSILDLLSRYGLIWFLTFQKLPFLVIILQLFWLLRMYLFILGIIFCYVQMIFYKSYKKLFLVSSVESFNWLLLIVFFSFFNFFVFIIFYFFIIFYLLLKLGVLECGSVGWEVTLIFLNIPFSINFLVKIISLRGVCYNFNLVFLFILLIMFLSVLSFRFWLLNIRSEVRLFIFYNNRNFFFFVFSLIILFFFYFSSKIYYIILIR